MQGIWVKDEGGNMRRPKSKKEVKELVADEGGNGTYVAVEATSMFGNEYDGSVSAMPDGEVYFVGPDPYTKRNFYGTIVKKNGKVVVK